MPCEFQVEWKQDGRRGTMGPCGRTAKYFVSRGGLGEIRVWLCWQHERYCAVVLQWELKQLQPPEPQG